MGNPNAHNADKPWEEPVVVPNVHNGVMSWVPGNLLARGANTLPKAGPDQEGEPVRKVILEDVPRFGRVEVTYELASHLFRRTRIWSWRCTRADVLDAAA